MIINIVGGGPSDLLPYLPDFNEEECVWVGVDRGSFTLLEHGIIPITAFGDFDSVTETELVLITEKVKDINTFRKEKDETDMEYALMWALAQNPAKIRLFGATGGRLDHFFANVQLLLKPLLNDCACLIEMIDKKNLLYLTTPGQHHLQKMIDKQYVSFIPLVNEVVGLTLAGFKYPLKDQLVPLGSTLCISNELINDYGNFSFTKGILMVVRSCD